MSAKKADDLNTNKTAKTRSSNRKNSKRKPTPASWKKGQSGNPRGRPRKDMSLAEAWRDFLDEPEGPRDRRSRKEILAHCLFAMATKEGSVAAARLLRDTVVAVEVEDRLASLEEKVRTLVSGTKYGGH